MLPTVRMEAALAKLGLLSSPKKADARYRRLNARAFREALAEVMEFSERTKEPVIVTRYGEDRVALVSIDDLWKLQTLNTSLIGKLLDRCTTLEEADFVFDQFTKHFSEHLQQLDEFQKLLDVHALKVLHSVDSTLHNKPLEAKEDAAPKEDLHRENQKRPN